jgi:hypothetical protein
MGVPVLRLLRHDLSKFTWVEWKGLMMRYVVCSHLDKDELPADIEAMFHHAWLHHIHHNDHHSSHWLIPDSKVGGSRTVVYMPRVCALEMVADWRAAGMVYAGSPDISDWLNANYVHEDLHTLTRMWIDKNLMAAGYEKVGEDEPWRLVIQ